MFLKFPEDSTPDDVTTIEEVCPVTTSNSTEVGPFVISLVERYLEEGIATHRFDVLINPHQTSAGSGQKIIIHIRIEDNFS